MAIRNISQEYSPSILQNNWFALSLMFDNIMFAVQKKTTEEQVDAKSGVDPPPLVQKRRNF